MRAELGLLIACAVGVFVAQGQDNNNWPEYDISSFSANCEDIQVAGIGAIGEYSGSTIVGPKEGRMSFESGSTVKTMMVMTERGGSVSCDVSATTVDYGLVRGNCAGSGGTVMFGVECWNRMKHVECHIECQ